MSPTDIANFTFWREKDISLEEHIVSCACVFARMCVCTCVCVHMCASDIFVKQGKLEM